MRELNMEDVEQVSGGTPTEAVALWTTALGLAGLAGIAGLGVVTAFAASPFVAAGAIALSFGGGWIFNKPPTLTTGTVTAGSGLRESDC